MDVMYTDSITGKGKRRWYYFQLTGKKKVTAYMSPVADATVDNDLDLYKLDTTNGTLSVIAQSQNPASHYELLSYVAEPGGSSLVWMKKAPHSRRSEAHY